MTTDAKDRPKPRVFSLSADALSALRAEIAAGKMQDPSIDVLREQADKALAERPLSVMDKTIVPPSGDKHDYMSRGPYWWPDPAKADGLPYIRRDGEMNPEIHQIPDHNNIQHLISVTHTLALGYYLLGNEAYADHAAELLRVWFLDPGTRMNPNLNYGQGIPGRVLGRGTGLIDTRTMYKLVDTVGLLAGSKAWTPAEQHGMEEWCARFLDWMLQSPNGRDEGAAKNNHGSYYDVQIVSLALFTGRTGLARKVLEEVPDKRIRVQIEPDGRQPLELARTKSLGYSTMNLAGLFELATLGENVGVDLWAYQTKDGRSIRKALDFLVPYVDGREKWPYKQIAQYNAHEMAPLLLTASYKYKQRQYKEVAFKLEPNIGDHVEHAMYLRPGD